MLWIKAFHIIAMVAWFAGLFYLPRLFVYHADAEDNVSITRFQVMERRLYYGITWPAGMLTSILGLWLLIVYMPFSLSAHWMHAKLGLVVLLWMYHLRCGYYLKQFKKNHTQKSSLFYRFFNECPTILLIGIITMVVVRPI